MSGVGQSGATVVAACGRCGSEDLYFVACPDHHWAVGSICFGCLFTNRIESDCPDCGWKGEPNALR